jgi:hypothetical protein
MSKFRTKRTLKWKDNKFVCELPTLEDKGGKLLWKVFNQYLVENKKNMIQLLEKYGYDAATLKF